MDFGMQGFDSALENFRRTGEVGDLGGRNALDLQSLGRAAGGKNFDTVGMQLTGKIDNPSLIGNRDQCALDFHFLGEKKLVVAGRDFNIQSARGRASAQCLETSSQRGNQHFRLQLGLIIHAREAETEQAQKALLVTGEVREFGEI